MASGFFELSPEDKRAALGVASTRSGRPIHLLEKDAWVVWTLQQLFASPFRDHLVFKGGTSLSKAYHAIDRFSEDIDITYDIRAIAEDLFAQFPDGLPKPRSQQSKWTDEIRRRLATWVACEMLTYIEQRLAETDKGALATADGDSIIIRYRPIAEGTGYVAPQVKIEFGARSTGEPFEMRAISAAAAPYLSDVSFPECSARTMRAERTFWEKATAIHVYCQQGELGGERFSRHWYDLAQLDGAGVVNRALQERDLGRKVAAHKAVFFREKNAAGEVVDYLAAVDGKLQLVPEGAARAILAADYAKMLEDGLLPEGAKSFEEVLESCAGIEKRANEPVRK